MVDTDGDGFSDKENVDLDTIAAGLPVTDHGGSNWVIATSTSLSG